MCLRIRYASPDFQVEVISVSVTVMMDLSVKPERLDELKTALSGLLPDTRAYDGCEGIRINQDLDDPNHVVFIENWASKQHFEKYFAWRTETGVIAQLMGFVTTPPATTYLSDTGI